MSYKIKLAAFLTVASSWLNMSAKEEKTSDPVENSNKTEQVVAPVNKTDSLQQQGTDTIQFFPIQEKGNGEEIRAKIEKNKEAYQDSLILVLKEENLKNSKELMLYLIAHFEGVKCKAYLDKAAGIWTINIGNTWRPDGKKVRYGDCIRDEKESLYYVSAHIDKYMADDMIKYLPLHKMTQEEIAVMGSLCYNCGSGILRNKNQTPSAFAQTACEYFITHGDSVAKEFDKYFLSKCTVKGRVNKAVEERRKNELTFLHNEVKITIDDNVNDGENVINLKKAVLGTLYGCKGNPETIMSRFEIDSQYYCPTDSLKDAINKEFMPKTNVKKKVTPSKSKTPAKKAPLRTQQRRTPQKKGGR